MNLYDSVSDLDCRMQKRQVTATIERLAVDGWQAKADTDNGFVFIRREAERRLLMLTPRDPYDTALQSFDPFR